LFDNRLKRKAMRNIDRQGQEINTMMHPALITTAPVVPASAEPEKPKRKPSDPSSTTKNIRYPVPSFFEQRLEMVE
jgi:hypothetical protein